MSECFHGFCPLRQGHSMEGRNDCKRDADTRKFLGKTV